MALIRWSARSLDHLESIHAWIAKDSVLQAGRMVEQIWERTQVVSEFPRIGHFWQFDGDAEIRLLFYGHHKVPYRYDPRSDAVEILGVFHGRMEFEKLFRV
ncbi:MAG TPA: type II toxin-antitoxin system RelE/ParE family toxin [Fibrobacteria bacterium]|nr:type II toxin-antitoxin system RelE/ParE family toxin [Fibrobacteria bacterium]